MAPLTIRLAGPERPLLSRTSRLRHSACLVYCAVYVLALGGCFRSSTNGSPADRSSSDRAAADESLTDQARSDPTALRGSDPNRSNSSATNAALKPSVSEDSRSASAQKAPAEDNLHPVVKIDTSLGSIRVQLDRQHAPQTVENFLRYVEDRFYDGTIFHRVIDNFMIQGGGLTPDGREKTTRAPISLEVHPALRHAEGTIAMARTSNPNSARAQFYITDTQTPHLDGGYAAFGRVVEGMSVVQAISEVKTDRNRPVEDVLIERIRVEAPAN
ncbi:MAG: peptidylprolyl isomerase [Myxococcota bacterium]